MLIFAAVKASLVISKVVEDNFLFSLVVRKMKRYAISIMHKNANTNSFGNGASSCSEN